MRKQPFCLVLPALILCLGAELPLQARSLPAQEKLKEREETSPAASNENKSSALEEISPVFTPEERAELQEMAKDNTNASEEQLRELLREYSLRFPGLVTTAGVTLNQQPGDYRDKRNAVMWQYASVSNVNSITVQPNPRVALIDLLTYTTRASSYVDSADGKAFLGKYQPHYAEVMKAADEWAWWLADFVLGDKDYDILKREVTDWCAKNPMTSFMGRENIGLLAGDRFVPPPSQQLGDSLFFSGLEKGVDNTSAELKQANRTLENLYVLMDWMPIYVYWTGEIAAYKFLESETGRSVVDFINGLDETQRRLNETAGYFANLDDFIKPFADEMSRPENEDVPRKFFAALEHTSGLMERLGRLEDDVESLLTDAQGVPLSERIASIDASLQRLAVAGDQLEKLSPVIDELQDPDKITGTIEGMAIRVILVFFVCLLISQVLAAWLVEKIRRKSPNS